MTNMMSRSRLFTAVAEFKNNGLTDGAPALWSLIAGPLLGGLIGAAWNLAIHRYLPAKDRGSPAPAELSARL